MDLHAHLNPEQVDAVTWLGGPLLILAGAGSGKTRVLVYRVLWLAAEAGVDPGEVLAVTFTNKAAGEMKSRLAAQLGEELARHAWFHTFHGACLRILRREIDGRLDRYTSSFGIYDDDEQVKVVKAALAKANVSETFHPPRSMLARIHDCKNRMVSPAESKRDADDFFTQTVAKVYAHYQELLAANNAVDFDDILLLTVRLFDEHPAVLQRYQRRFRHVLVDEYQDTNKAQYRLVSQLAAGYRNLACVGDDDQGIYAWRGADIQNILDFQKDYPDAKVVKLERNYRSTKTILQAAMAVVSRNRGRLGKRLWTENPVGSRISLLEAKDERDEARWIAEEIQRLAAAAPAGGSGAVDRRRRDIAVFYRTNAQSRALEEALRGRGIPYRLIGALKFYERAEIKDVIAYLRAAINPSDSIALARILNVPPRGIGDTTVERIEAFAEAERIGFGEALGRVEEIAEIKSGTRKKIAEFHALLAGLREAVGTTPPAAFLRRICDETGYLDWLAKSGMAASGDDPGGRIENVGQLIASASELAAEIPDATAADFLDRVQLVADVDDFDPTADAVTLMTFHAAKGLEFPIVFMTGFEEGIFPHSRTLDPDAGPRALEEERRLCYVGMTRARERLFITYASERATWGPRRPMGASRFLAEIPPEAMTRVATPWARGSSDGFFAAAGSFVRARRSPVEEDGPTPATHDEFDQRTTWDDADDRPATGRHGGVGPSARWRRGMRIVHAQFGEGEIQAVEGGGDHAKISVAFDRGGVRKLLLKYAGKDLRPG